MLFSVCVFNDFVFFDLFYFFAISVFPRVAFSVFVLLKSATATPLAVMTAFSIFSVLRFPRLMPWALSAETVQKQKSALASAIFRAGLSLSANNALGVKRGNHGRGHGRGRNGPLFFAPF